MICLYPDMLCLSGINITATKIDNWYMCAMPDPSRCYSLIGGKNNPNDVGLEYGRKCAPAYGRLVGLLNWFSHLRYIPTFSELSTRYVFDITWWRHQMETFFALLAICAGNSPVTGEFPEQRPVMWSFGVFFGLRLNKPLIKQWWGWWFETPSRPLCRHCNDVQLSPQLSYLREW